jgi:hypothetical protein
VSERRIKDECRAMILCRSSPGAYSRLRWADWCQAFGPRDWGIAVRVSSNGPLTTSSGGLGRPDRAGYAPRSAGRPPTTHGLSVAQMLRWCDGVAARTRLLKRKEVKEPMAWSPSIPGSIWTRGGDCVMQVPPGPTGGAAISIRPCSGVHYRSPTLYWRFRVRCILTVHHD